MSSTSSTPAFRTVLRGYEAGEVDRHMGELHEQLRAEQQRADEAQQRSEQMARRAADLERRLVAVEQAAAERDAKAASQPAEEPVFTSLGKRVGQILQLADDEANALRAGAKRDADAFRGDAEEAAAVLRAEADRYAAQTRSAAETDAALALEEARRHADEILDEAAQDATARREEAEALYERQRANSAQAAADFETTLAQRRERAEQDFAERAAAVEQQVRILEERATAVHNDAERARSEADLNARRALEDAQQHAQQLVAEAKARAERIRAESERELAAAMNRRDSINAQLANVRQMLATLSGGTVRLDEVVDAPPAPPAEDATTGQHVERTAEESDTEPAVADQLDAEPVTIEPDSGAQAVDGVEDVPATPAHDEEYATEELAQTDDDANESAPDQPRARR